MAAVPSESGDTGGRHPPERRLLLLGGRRAGKTSCANSVLGDQVFQAGTETTHSNVGQTEIYGRRVTVVDTPPWGVPGHVADAGGGGDDDDDDDDSESATDGDSGGGRHPRTAPASLDSEDPCMGAVLCPPGPHVILLVVSVSQPFKETQRRAAEDQLGALGGGTWRYSMVLFTGVDKLPKGTFVEEHIANTGEALQWLVERCGSRYHAFDNSKKDGDENTQVPELMEKVEEMITDNQGWYFEVNELILLEEEQARRALEEERMRMEEHARQRDQMIGGPPRELRLLLLGWKGVGKSSVGNTILGRRDFEVGQETEMCLRRQALVSGRRVTVVDTPGWDWFSVRRTPKRIRQESQRGAALLRPGPHTLLLVLPVVSSLTTRKRRTLLAHIEALFGERASLHTMVLFSCGDWLGRTPIEDHIQRGGRELHRLLEYCGNYYHVLDSKTPGKDSRSVSDLLDKIEEMVRENGDEAFLPVQSEWPLQIHTPKESERGQFTIVRQHRARG
ncbi:GTPase IMAP family member 8 isoform X1 [Gadus macrocephalus]|uniref:GTPase IMAP family member 8 isoform X1 n=1 Tax=Gadus macrocephalus TaxID=80720 RepID=UPI0028CB2EB3|nr:GTPase IMAP family member 8 isoform X1 [Gadus macrocephalus]XP_059928261.1 GTPase IMAP family member 8 isoform X1 [Gadus macrocephalus]XP_059928270.1 GTPase IMAP family member 8 isoform X1 [Gadus macrocephalus]